MLFYLKNRFFYKLARVYKIFSMYKFILINVHTITKNLNLLQKFEETNLYIY